MPQNNWRWCSKCQGHFFAGNPTSGACPAGGGHTFAGSGNYTLQFASEGTGGQTSSGATSAKACFLLATRHRDPALQAAAMTSPEVGVTDFNLYRLRGRPIGGGATSAKACFLLATRHRDPALQAADMTSPGAVTTAYRLFNWSVERDRAGAGSTTPKSGAARLYGCLQRGK